MPPLKPKTDLEKQGLKIAQLLQRGGHQALWVGGTVRDILLKRPFDNIDIATDAKPDQVEAVLRKAKINNKPVGKKYGTILAVSKAGPVEITTFRKEGRYADRRHPKDVEFVTDLETDSQRRDLTVNAMYLDPVTGQLHDPQNGQKDLKARLLKFVGDPKKRIDEDALRMMRAARLASQLEFKLERNSFAAIKTRAKYIQGIAGERVRAELEKMLVLGGKHEAVRLLDALGLLRFIMPEVTDLKRMWHKSKTYHLEGNVFEHVMLVLENTPAGNVDLAYAALYHDVGKMTTAVPKEKQGRIVNSFPKHEFVSARMFQNRARALHLSRHSTQLVLWITKMHMIRYAFLHTMGQAKKIALASHKFFPQLLELWRADSLGNIKLIDGKRVTTVTKAYAEGRKLLANINAKQKLADKLCDGAMIMRVTGMKSGPQVGKIKSQLRDEIILGNVKTVSQARNFLQKFSKSS